MKISEVINELNDIICSNGDLDCYLIGDYVGSDPVDLVKVYGTKCIIFNEKDGWVRPKEEREKDNLSWEDYEEANLKKMVSELPFEEILKMLEDKFRYGVIEYREDGLIEISPRGWSEDEHLLSLLNENYEFSKYCIGRIEATLFYVKDINDRWDKNYDITKCEED